MGNQYEQSPCLSSGDVPLVATNDYAVCYAIDQQGGKGGANWLNEICPTILSNSHGMPHAVCYATVYDARGNGGGGWRMPNNHGGSPRPNNGLHSDCLSYAPSSHGGYAAGVGTLRASGGDIGGGSEMLVLQRRFSNVIVQDTDISPTIEAGGVREETICL